MANQISIKESVIVDGVNVYNGHKNTATFYPSEEDSGLVFLVGGVKVPAKLEFAENKRKAIRLDNGDGKIYLVEHLLSAVYALGIDNLLIELSDGVCPTTDNCAQEYFKALREARVAQQAFKLFWKYAKDSETCLRRSDEKGPDCLGVSGSEGFVIDYLAYYPHKVVGKQNYRFQFDEDVYAKDIANACSPAFLKSRLFKEAFLLLGRAGLHGINEKNYLLITSKNADKYANSEEFDVRHDGQEFVRHKVLDVMGTLALTGRQFRDTKFKFEMTGHKFDLWALKKLFNDRCFAGYVRAF